MTARTTWLVFLVTVLALSSRADAATPVTLHVAPNGNDGWTGRLAAANPQGTDGPLATLLGARDAIRKMRAAGAEAAPITVLIQAGTYYMAAPFVLEPQDSGTAESPIVYAAQAGQKPILSGGRVIRGWKQGADGVWTAQIPEVAARQWYFQQLFVNGRRCIRARSPNTDYFRVASTLPGPRDAQGNEIARDKFVFSGNDLQPWQQLGDVQIVLMHSWETSIHPVKSVDVATHTVQFTAPQKEWWPIGLWEKSQRYYVENALELLDQPGEWYLNRATGVLSYRPMPGEQMEQATVVAPRLVELVRFAGNADEKRFVQHVTLRGLAFEHGDWVLKPEGNSSTQAAVETPANVMADGARQCAMENCEISHVGQYAVWLRRGCKECRIVGCRIRDFGAGGVRIGEAALPPNDETESSNNVVDNNHIYDGGHVFAAGVGIFVAQSSRNVISHNEIHDLLYSGMSIGWNWGDSPTRCHYNTIEYNHVHHVLKGTLSDGGAIYALGVSTGSVIRNNVFHDVWPYEQPPFGWGIYLDATTSGYLVENNVVYNTKSGGMMYNNGGHENIVRNNIFALSANYSLWPFWEKRVNTFQKNIVYMTQGTLIVPHANGSLQQRIDAKESLGVWDENVYWDTQGADALRFLGRDFALWQKMGLDVHSRIADPQFENVEQCDFRLKASSPALQLGFKQIDTSKVGLYGDPAWVAEAKNLQYPKTVLPPPPSPPTPKEVDDDFEKTPLNGHPQGAVVSGEVSGASVHVTSEQAAGGKQSVKVTDTKAVQPSWQPHFYYEPHLAGGVVRQSFDLRLMPGAVVALAWRDDAGWTQYAGPNVTFNAEGQVVVNGKELLKAKTDGWIHVEIEAALVKNAPKTFKLTITPPNGAPQVFADLAMPSPAFSKLDWAGFISVAAADTAFFVDNLQIKKVKQ